MKVDEDHWLVVMARAEKLFRELKKADTHDEGTAQELAAVVAFAKEIREGAFSLG